MFSKQLYARASSFQGYITNEYPLPPAKDENILTATQMRLK